MNGPPFLLSSLLHTAKMPQRRCHTRLGHVASGSSIATNAWLSREQRSNIQQLPQIETAPLSHRAQSAGLEHPGLIIFDYFQSGLAANSGQVVARLRRGAHFWRDSVKRLTQCAVWGGL
jgi:hypothetical protein